MLRRLIILLLIVGCASHNLVYTSTTETTTDININDKNDILYFKDGTFKECQHTLSVTEGFHISKFGVWSKVNCDEETYEIELVDKMVLKDGRVTSSQELINNTRKLKFWYYSITTGIIVLLVIITI